MDYRLHAHIRSKETREVDHMQHERHRRSAPVVSLFTRDIQSRDILA